MQRYELKEVRIQLKDGDRLKSQIPMTDPEAAVRTLQDLMKDMDREMVCVVNLDNKLRPINYNIVSIGGLSACEVPIPNVFKSSILSNSAGILMVHNHPSGDSSPSMEDISITERVAKCGDLMGINLVDHIIIGGNGYYSFKNEGALPYSEVIGRVHEGKGEYHLTRREKLQELTDKLEQGVKSVFESESYKAYLSTMAKFHRYSVGNSILIHCQMPQASAVAGYTDWQRKFGRQVLRGEKGIQIIAPSPYKAKEDVILPDGTHSEKEVTRMGFRAATVFDVSQTEGKPLPTFGVDELKGSVDKYDDMFRALQEVSPVPIGFEQITTGAKGYYSHVDNRIAIKAGMDQLASIKTGIHEVAHSMLHTREQLKSQPKDAHTREVEAESIAFVVTSTLLGQEAAADYSFPYIASWSSDKELPELKTSLETIRETADQIITAVEEKIASYEKERTPVAEQSVEAPDKDLLHIQLDDSFTMTM